MKRLLAIAFALSLFGCNSKTEEQAAKDAGHHGHDHGAASHQHGTPKAGARLMVTTDPASPVAGQPVTLDLMIHAADGTMVRQFDLVHEEKVHLAIISEGFGEFAHLHPSVDAKGNLSITHTFPAGGGYRLFADYKPAGGEHATATGLVSIGGVAPPASPLTPNAPGEIQADGVRASVAAGPVKAGVAVRLAFTLRAEDGSVLTLEPYMGESGHLMVVSVEDRRYVHVHPVGAEPARGAVEFEATFPTAGLYKGWGQFKHGGKVRVVPFVMKVE